MMGKSKNGKSVGSRFLCALAAFGVMVLLAAETVVAVSYVVPTLSVLLFSYGQISIDRTVAIGDFAMGDLVILMMMWGAPVLVMCFLAGMVQWQVMKRGARLIARLVRASMGRTPAGGEGKGDIE